MSKPKLNQPDVEQSTTLEPSTSTTIGAYGTPESHYFYNPTSPIPLKPTLEEVIKEWEDDDCGTRKEFKILKKALEVKNE